MHTCGQLHFLEQETVTEFQSDAYNRAFCLSWRGRSGERASPLPVGDKAIGKGNPLTVRDTRLDPEVLLVFRWLTDRERESV